MTCWKKRLSVFLVVTLVLTFSIISVANADSIAEKVQAFMGVKVLYNGKELTAEKQPYIINDTTYVPLRMLMDNFGKDISYDSATNKVIIKDKENTDETSLNKKINELIAINTLLQNERNKLKAENTTLKSQNAALKTENNTLSAQNITLKNRVAALENEDDELIEIEDDLYDDYEDAGDDYFNDDDILFSVVLYGDDDDLEFEVYLDFDDSDENDDMTDLSITYIKNLMRALYEDVEDYIEDTDYEDADITGIIEDDEDNEVEYDGSTFDFDW